MIQGVNSNRGLANDPFQAFAVEFGAPLEGVSPTTKIDGLVPLDGMDGVDSQAAPTFGEVLHDALESVQHEKAKAESLTLDFAAGKPVDIHTMMIQVAKSDVMMQVTSAVVSKSATSLNQLLQTQI
jgi:flagellar hook-basal body complex protein FliE